MPNRDGRPSRPVTTPNPFDWSTRPEVSFWDTWQVRRNNDQAETLRQTVVMDEDQVRAAEAEERRPISMADLERMSSEDTPTQVEEEPTFAIRADDPAWSGVTPADAPFGWDTNGEPTEEAPRLIQTPPSDPMEPHESDTSAVRQFRQIIIDHYNGVAPLPQPSLQSYESMIATLTQNSRNIWVSNGGSMARPSSRRREGGSLGETLARASRSLRGDAPQPRPVQVETGQVFYGNIPETSTMTTVASHFGIRANYPSLEKHPLIVGTHLAGVEIELENLAIEHPSFRYWTAKHDGSLRNNGMEFVCSSPWGGVDLYNAAVEIDGFLFNNSPDDTWRCSTHVHIDSRDMTANQVKKMILAYVFFERVLFKCSGWHRYKNNFCVALGFAQGQLEDLGNWWAENDSTFLQNLGTRWDKYTAINFLPMANFGSIEFRLGEAKWHKGQLIRLTNRFLSLKEVAVANSSLSDEDFVNMLAQSNPADIIRKGIPKGMNNLGEDLEVGYKLCHDILSLAKLRRRNRRMFKPDVNDGSRVVLQPRRELFSNGWNHCVAHLQNRHTNLDFEDLRRMRDEDGNNYVWTFKFLSELQDMMNDIRMTFEIEWFMPQANRSSLITLYNRYRSAQRVDPVELEDADDDEDGEGDSEW